MDFDQTVEYTKAWVIVAWPQAVELSSEYSMIAWGGDNTGADTDGPVLIFSTSDGSLRNSYQITDFKIYSVGFNFDDEYLAVAGEKRSSSWARIALFNIDAGTYIYDSEWTNVDG